MIIAVIRAQGLIKVAKMLLNIIVIELLDFGIV